jgi:hypothetical protein
MWEEYSRWTFCRDDIIMAMEFLARLGSEKCWGFATKAMF